MKFRSFMANVAGWATAIIACPLAVILFLAIFVTAIDNAYAVDLEQELPPVTVTNMSLIASDDGIISSADTSTSFSMESKIQTQLGTTAGSAFWEQYRGRLIVQVDAFSTTNTALVEVEVFMGDSGILTDTVDGAATTATGVPIVGHGYASQRFLPGREATHMNIVTRSATTDIRATIVGITEGTKNEDALQYVNTVNP